MRVSNTRCWICDEPALSPDGSCKEPAVLSVVLARLEHVRCQRLAALARRPVYQTNDERLGPNRPAKLHIRTGGPGSVLLCKNQVNAKRRVGMVRDLGGVHAFSRRVDACAVCARELAGQVGRILERQSGRVSTPGSDCGQKLGSVTVPLSFLR